MHNHDVKHPSRPGCEPGTPRLQVDTNEPSGPAYSSRHNEYWEIHPLIYYILFVNSNFSYLNSMNCT